MDFHPGKLDTKQSVGLHITNAEFFQFFPMNILFDPKNNELIIPLDKRTCID